VKNCTWDMLAWRDAEGCSIHREVTILICAEHVIGLQSRVQALTSPNAANTGAAFEHEYFFIWMQFDVSLGCCEAIPS
jgi:hypothetical protein